MKKTALLFLISLFFVSCVLKDLDLETVPEDSNIEKTHEGIIINVDEAMWRSIKGLAIFWDKSIKVNPETVTNFWFVYSGSQQDIEKLKGLKGHRVKVVYAYEDDTSMDFEGKRWYVAIIRIVRVEETEKDRE